MNLYLPLPKRFILGILVLSTFVVLLILHANQTNASKMIESSGTQTSFMPSYIVRDTIQHSFPNYRDTATDSIHRRM
jgi:hypothetical protein